MSEPTKPLTDEELAAWREALRPDNRDTNQALQYMAALALLAEVDRLRAENELLRGESDEDTSQMATLEDEVKYWRAQVAAMRPIVEAVARHGMDAFGGRAGGPWVWKCPECGQNINAELHTPSGSVTGGHLKTCPVPPAVDLVMQWAKEGDA